MPSRTASLNLLKKCEYVAPGQIGVCRKSMLTRETLQRPKLGEALTRGRPKQPKDFVYGIKSKIIPNELIQCLTWPKEEQIHSIDPDCLPRDFHRINVESTKQGIHPVPEWLKFANEKDYRLNPTKRVLGRLKKPKFPDDMSFGLLAKPSTPMACIMSQKYRSLWEQQALEDNKIRMTLLARSQNDIPQPFDSTASVLSTVPITWNKLSNYEIQNYWHLKRFRNRPSKLNTHWSSEEAKRVLREK